MKEITKFKKWAEKNRKGRGLLIHFYEVQGKQKPYYTKADFAYYNLFTESPNWIVKGTEGHGIRSPGKKTSRVPCLNCYQINNQFYDALEEHLEQAKKKYEFALVLNKLNLKLHFGEENIVDVSLWDENNSRPLPANCWRYDIARARRALIPFNFCDVVRLKVPKSYLYNIPLVALPQNSVMGFLVRGDGYDAGIMNKILEQKGMDDIGVFPVL